VVLHEEVSIRSWGSGSCFAGLLHVGVKCYGSAKKVDALAEAALAAMKKRAAELKTTGVAVVAFAEGESIQGWTSKMAVVGRMKDAPSATDKGNNLLGMRMPRPPRWPRR